MCGMAIVIAVAAATAVPPPAPLDYDSIHLAGDCVAYEGPGLGEDLGVQSLEGRDCAGPHSHTVLAVTIDESQCPAGTDAVFWMPGGVHPLRCLAAVE